MTKAKDLNKQLKKSIEDSILSQEDLKALTEFGRRLRILRKSSDMTQGELAEKMCVTASAINKYESASNVFPSVEILLKLSVFFNVSADYLLLGTKNPPNGENTISGEVSNSSVVQANHGSVVSGKDEKISNEAKVLVRIHENLSPSGKRKLLRYALELEDSEAENAS